MQKLVGSFVLLFQKVKFMISESLLKAVKSLKKATKPDMFHPLAYLEERTKIRDLNDLIGTDDAQHLLALSRREEEGRAKERQPNMEDSKEGDEMGSQIGDNFHINVTPDPTPATPPSPKPASNLAKAGLIALAAGVPIGLGLGALGLGLSMMGGDTTTTVIEETTNPESLRLGPPIVKPKG